MLSFFKVIIFIAFMVEKFETGKITCKSQKPKQGKLKICNNYSILRYHQSYSCNILQLNHKNVFQRNRWKNVINASSRTNVKLVIAVHISKNVSWTQKHCAIHQLRIAHLHVPIIQIRILVVVKTPIIQINGQNQHAQVLEFFLLYRYV